MAELALLAGALGLAHCDPLPTQRCRACEAECPGDLVCEHKFCVNRGEDPEACESPAIDDGAGGTSGSTSTGSSGQHEGGSGGSAGTAAAPPVDPCEPPPSTCNAEFVTGRQLETECADSFSFTLEARCECDGVDTHREVKWKTTEAIEGLVLSDDGTLSGSLPDGEYGFEVSAEIDATYEVQDGFTLTVRDRCWVSFVADDTNGEPRVVAARLNSDEVTPLPEASGGRLVGFDTSPEGRFVARVSQTPERSMLDLVEFDGTEMIPHLIEVPGNHVAHAFSADDRWLALVSTGADDTQQTLDLIDLAEEPEIVASSTIAFEEHLTWSDAGGILYVGRRASDPRRRVVLEGSVQDGTLGAETVVAATQSIEGETFHDLLVGDDFYLVLTSHRLVFVDRRSEPVVHEPPDALSPDLSWLSNDAGTVPGSVIDPLALPRETRPFATASECDLVRAWSSDGSTFVCSGDAGALVYSIDPDGDSLPRVPLKRSEPFSGDSLRIALSATGRWLALVPDDGLVLVPATEYATDALDTPRLGPPNGTPEWDFFFTPAEERLIVQRGPSLFVVPLDDGVSSEPWEVEGVTLPAIPACKRGWTFEQDQWCGAPQFRGNVLLSPGEGHLAFVDDAGEVRVIDLEAQRAVNLGPASSFQVEQNLQFL